MTKATKNTINNQILIKKLNLSLLTKFRDFIKKNHSKNHIFVKSKKVLDYFYRNGKNYNFYLARHNQSRKHDGVNCRWLFRFPRHACGIESPINIKRRFCCNFVVSQLL